MADTAPQSLYGSRGGSRHHASMPHRYAPTVTYAGNRRVASPSEHRVGLQGRASAGLVAYAGSALCIGGPDHRYLDVLVDRHRSTGVVRQQPCDLDDVTPDGSQEL